MKQVFTNLEDLQTYIVYELELEKLTQEFMDTNKDLFIHPGLSQELFLQECENEIAEIYRDSVSLDQRINDLIKDYSFKRIIKTIVSLMKKSSSEALVKDMIASFTYSFYGYCMFFEKRRISKSEFLRDYLRDFFSDEYIQTVFAQGIETSMTLTNRYGSLHSSTYLDKMTQYLADYYFSQNKEVAKAQVEEAMADTDNKVKIHSPAIEQTRKKLFLVGSGCKLFIPDKWATVQEDAETIKKDIDKKSVTERHLDAMSFPWEGRTVTGETLGKHVIKKAQEICEKYILRGHNETEEKIAALLYVSNLKHLKDDRKSSKNEQGLFWTSVKSIVTSMVQIDQILNQVGPTDLDVNEDWLTLNFLECVARDLFDFNRIIKTVKQINEDGWSYSTTNLFDLDIIFDLVLSDVSCRESFHWIQEMHEVHDIKLIGFTKKELHQSQVITAALLNIDKPHIKSVIEDILLKMEGIDNLSDNIEKRIETEAVNFIAQDVNGNTNPSQSLIHGYAVNFLIFYLVNPIYLLPLASYTNFYISDLMATLFAELRTHGIKAIVKEAYEISNMQEDKKTEVLNRIGDLQLLNQVTELIKIVETILKKFHEEKLKIKERNHPFTIISYSKEEYKNWNRISEKFLESNFIIQVASAIWLDGLFGRSDNWYEIFINKTEDEKADCIIQRAHDIFLFNEIEELESYVSDLDLNVYEEIDSVNVEEKLYEMEQKLKEQAIASEIAAQTKDQYKELIQPLKNQIKDLTSNYSALHSQNQKLLKAIEEERKEKEKLREDQQELIKLRELMFDMGKTEDESEEKDVSNELASILKEKKIVIIGGHDKMLLELKQKYDSITSFTKETANIAPVIRNADHVFICYEWINHSLYYKAMDVIKSCGVKMDYIKGMNTKKAEAFIFNKL